MRSATPTPLVQRKGEIAKVSLSWKILAGPSTFGWFGVRRK
ncbi:MAG: hypothetical protein ACXU9E_08120 [Syntrophales bacterium]